MWLTERKPPEELLMMAQKTRMKCDGVKYHGGGDLIATIRMFQVELRVSNCHWPHAESSVVLSKRQAVRLAKFLVKFAELQNTDQGLD
jgi:hypothetical protein